MRRFLGFFVTLFFGVILSACATVQQVDELTARVATLERELPAAAIAVGQKADRAEVVAVANQQRETAGLLAKTAESIGQMRREVAGNTAAITRVEAKTEANTTAIAAVKTDLVKIDATVGQLGISLNERLRSLEKRMVGIRRVVARVGALEDSHGIDHDKRLFRLSSFASGKADLTRPMTKELDKVAALAKDGWEVKSVVGFTDSRPYKNKDGSDKNPTLAGERAKAVALHLSKTLNKDLLHEGRGHTTKFGDLDMNRSVLIYLERSQSTPAPSAAPVAPPAPPVAPPAAPPVAPPTPPSTPPAATPPPASSTTTAPAAASPPAAPQK